MTETMTAPRAPRSLLAFLREGRGGGSGDNRLPGNKKRFWSAKKVIALAMMLLIPLIGVFGLTAANANTPGKDDPLMKYSFYNVASATTSFFSTVQDPDSTTKQFSQPWLNVMADPGSAGSLLGYADPKFSLSSGWLASGLSGSSDAIGYDTLVVKAETGPSTNTKYTGMVDYAYFGAALKGMGLDGTSTGLSLGFVNLVGGGIVMLLYLLSGAVDFFFTAVLQGLAALNPFKLFFLGVSAISPEFADGMVGGNSELFGGATGPFAGIASLLGGVYQLMNSLAWTVMVPLFIAVLLFSLLMFKKMDRGGAVKKLVIRIAFIGLGLPLLGSMYTGMINGMVDAATEGNAGSTRVVMSTYVDFESWALKSRLAIPEGANIAWDPNAAQPTGAAQANVRNTALAINNQSMGLGLKPIISSGAFDASWSSQIMEGAAGESTETQASSYDQTTDMLKRYMENAQLSAAAVETAAKGSLSQSTYYSENAETVKSWFESLQKDATGLNATDDDTMVPASSNPLVAVQGGTGLRASYVSGGGRQFSTVSSSCYRWNATDIVVGDNSPRACNLSPLAMYNYLNTDFGSTSMTMYSSQNAQSEATRSIHNSVNQVGTGTMSFLYWTNAVVLLGSFALIGIGYAFALIFASIRRTFQIMSATPFAMLGAIAAIAKVIVYTLALTLEVIMTIFVYKIVQEFLTAIPQIIEMPFSAVLNNNKEGNLVSFVEFLTTGWAFGMIVTLLSIIGVVAFTIMAMRMRKTLVKAVEEAVTKLIEKFMGTGVGMPAGGKMLPALAGGLAAGAGAAGANRMMSGAKNNASAIPGVPNAGADAVETADSGVTPADGGTAADGQLEIEGGGQLEIEGTDGAGDGGEGAGPSGNGDSGSPLELSAGRDGAAGEEAMGREVEKNGLSNPDAETPAPQVGGDDALSGASETIDKSNEGYAAADKQKLSAGKEGAEAAGHAAVAVGKGFAGDAAGATESGGRAVEHGGKAVAAGEQAKQKEEDAGRSSLDAPSQKHAKRAQQAERVSQVGAGVAVAAGTASATSGAGGSGSGKTPTPGPSKQAPAASPQRRQAPAAPRQRQQSQQPNQAQRQQAERERQAQVQRQQQQIQQQQAETQRQQRQQQAQNQQQAQQARQQQAQAQQNQQQAQRQQQQAQQQQAQAQRNQQQAQAARDQAQADRDREKARRGGA